MCDKCDEIDKAIERHRRMQRTILDQITVDRTRQLIVDLETLESTLHPKR
jgi:hypothetical protein